MGNKKTILGQVLEQELNQVQISKELSEKCLASICEQISKTSKK